MREKQALSSNKSNYYQHLDFVTFGVFTSLIIKIPQIIPQLSYKVLPSKTKKQCVWPLFCSLHSSNFHSMQKLSPEIEWKLQQYKHTSFNKLTIFHHGNQVPSFSIGKGTISKFELLEELINKRKTMVAFEVLKEFNSMRFRD